MQLIDCLHEANKAPLMPKSEATRCMLISLAPLAIGGLVCAVATAAMFM